MKTIQHFTALPTIVPLAIKGLFKSEDFALIAAHFPTPPFNIFIYWSRRSESDAAACWLNQMVTLCIKEIDSHNEAG